MLCNYFTTPRQVGSSHIYVVSRQQHSRKEDLCAASSKDGGAAMDLVFLGRASYPNVQTISHFLQNTTKTLSRALEPDRGYRTLDSAITKSFVIRFGGRLLIEHAFSH